MIQAALQFVASASLIVVAGVFLTRYADAIAELTGLGRVLIGSILLAGATSLPELIVDISAVRLGNPDLATGDLLGSSLFNLLILALLDLSQTSQGRMFSRQVVAHALSSTSSIVLTTLAALSILLGPRLSNVTLGPVGVGTIAIVIAYAFCIRLIFFDQRVSAHAKHSSTDEGQHPPTHVTVSLSRAAPGFALAAIAIVVAGPFLASAADQIADLTGLGGTFTGTTLVALCTSLPEFVAGFTAIRIGAFDLAVGNVFGSNAFNMVLFLPLDLVHPGSLFAAVSPNHALTALSTIVVTGVAIMGQLYQVEKRTRLIEPDAALILILIVGSLAGLYYLR